MPIAYQVIDRFRPIIICGIHDADRSRGIQIDLIIAGSRINHVIARTCINMVIASTTIQVQRIPIRTRIDSVIDAFIVPKAFPAGEATLQRYTMVNATHILRIGRYIERLASTALQHDGASLTATLQNRIAIAGRIILVVAHASQVECMPIAYQVIDCFRPIIICGIHDAGRSRGIQIDLIIAGRRIDYIIACPCIDTIVGLRTIQIDIMRIQ